VRQLLKRLNSKEGNNHFRFFLIKISEEIKEKESKKDLAPMAIDKEEKKSPNTAHATETPSYKIRIPKKPPTPPDAVKQTPPGT
jgi:hypothetical protein